MTTDYRDIIAAFVDSEPVGAEDLAAVLATSEGRDYLVDLLVLRGVMGGTHATTGVRQSAGRLKHKGLWLTAAAALFAVSGAAGFVAGRLTPGGPGAADVRASSKMTAPVTTSTTAPAPTHVIRLERGAGWTERSGGN